MESLCTLPTSIYKIGNNIPTGLHVHRGHDTRAFTFLNIQKLSVFLFTFEPQIAGLHPIHRMNNEYGHSMRDYSLFSLNFQTKYERRPTAAEFASKIFSLKTRGRMFRLPMGGKGYKPNNYKFGGIVKKAHPSGIIQANEGDGKDTEREDKLGPVLVDHGLTIINLLEHLGLHPQADYYKDKWQKHPADHNRQEVIESDVTWDFKQAVINPNTNEYPQALILTELFTTLRLLKKAVKKVASTEEYLAEIDLDAPGLWLRHSINLDIQSEEEPMGDDRVLTARLCDY